MHRLLAILVLLLGARQAEADWKNLGDLPAKAQAWEYETHVGGQTVWVTGVSFRATDATFQVLDNPVADRKTLAQALTAGGAFAGVNGNYFHPDFTPLGLVVVNGKVIHPQERAKLLGGVLAVRGGKIQLVRAEAFKMGSDLQQALQCGPWLVENGTPIPGLNTQRSARRTLVANNGKGMWAIMVISPITLAETAGLLMQQEFREHWATENALNLDGGSSTMLVAGPSAAPLASIPSFGPVANYLAVCPRSR